MKQLPIAAIAVALAWTPAMATDAALPSASAPALSPGALVVEVDAGSAAGRAGIKPGDVIAAVDDEPVANAEQLKRKIGRLPANTTVTLTVMRGSDTDRFKAIVATSFRATDMMGPDAAASARFAGGTQKV